jgi:hypothetical protein
MKNKKLIELGILSEDENSGVSAISLVENPAIEVDFLYFRAEQFVKPSAGESKDEFIGRCIPVLRGEGKPEDQSIAICYSYWENKMEITPNPCWKGYEPIGLKDKGGRKVPNCVKMAGYDFEELDIFGYKTRFFFICPGAVATFNDLMYLGPDDETIGMIRSAAVVADRVFEIEKEVIEEGIATPEQLMEAMVLVQDFYDVIYEIDEELSEGLGKVVVHNVQYMDGHLEKIMSYLPTEMSIDTAGLPPYVDEIGKKKDKYEDIILQTILDAAAKLGWANEEFANAQAAPFAGSSLEELRQNLQMQPEAKGFTVYKYEGPIGGNSRDYCRQMISLNRWYTYSDIETMEGIAVNAGFGLRGESTYSIWKYKGGPNCKHRWQKYYVTPDKSENKGPAPGRAGEKPIDMENNGYATSQRNWVNRSGFSALRFADEEQKVVVGPAMIPNMEIPRRDDDGDIYYVKFSEETIKEIMMKFMKEARTNDTNQDHLEDVSAGSYVYESWLVEDPETDKANLKYGFNVPAGTWMVSMKVDDKEVWKRIKNGELRGFSVEGLFSNMEEIQGLKKYLKVVKILKD